MKRWHMHICFGLVGLGVVLVAVGADALALLPAIGCAGMMVMMGVMMLRAGDKER